jgi:branched-chain amino acid transport system substrate-binding protein
MKFFSTRVRASVALSAVAVLATSACGGGGSGSDDVDEIKILVAAPLTGDSAESGQDMVNGAKLAADYLNEQGGVQSGELKGKKFVIESSDDQMETEAATTIAAKFAGEDDLFALTGFITSGQAQAAGVVLNKYKLPAFVSFASADYLTTEADNLVVVSASVSNFARVAGDFATKELGAKTVGSIAGDYSFLDSYYSGLDDSLSENGAKNVSKQTYAEGTADFSTILTRIEKSNPDVVMSGAFQADAGKIAAQVRRSGNNKPFVDFLGEGWGETFSEAAGSSLTEGDVYQMDPALVFPEKGSLLDEMNTRFKDEFGKSMPTASMHTFDSVLAIAAAIEAGATSKTDLLEYVTKADGEGLLGPIKYTTDLLPEERYGTMSKVTGTQPDDREKAATYMMRADGSIEESDGQ